MFLQLIVFSFVVSAQAIIPNGYIRKLSYQCGENASSDASAHIITDLNAKVFARCAGDRLVNFTTTDRVNYYLDVFYPGMGANSSQCVFVKRVNAEVYTIQVTFSYGERDNEVHNDLEVRSLTCTFDQNANKTSDTHTVNERLIAPQEVLANAGDKTSSRLRLFLCTINGHLLETTPIHLGRKVRIDAYSNGASGEQGIRITQCDAIGSETGIRYQVLRAGCGDGVVLRKTDGFITDGLHAKSPFFRMFRLENDINMAFECNFTLCEGNCDGNSCPFHRSRRELNEDPIELVMSTDDTSNSMYNFTRTEIGGFPATDHWLQSGRYYRLKVEVDPSLDVSGVLLHSCIFISKKRKSPPFSDVFLENGCGMKVLTNSQGFTSNGLTAYSDAFPGFNFRGDHDLSFQCNATLCSEPCDGHSCTDAPNPETSGENNKGFAAKAKRKRSFEGYHDIVAMTFKIVSSQAVEVVPGTVKTNRFAKH